MQNLLLNYSELSLPLPDPRYPSFTFPPLWFSKPPSSTHARVTYITITLRFLHHFSASISHPTSLSLALCIVNHHKLYELVFRKFHAGEQFFPSWIFIAWNYGEVQWSRLIAVENNLSSTFLVGTLHHYNFCQDRTRSRHLEKSSWWWDR